jgi:hypothetical protein
VEVGSEFVSGEANSPMAIATGAGRVKALRATGDAVYSVTSN